MRIIVLATAIALTGCAVNGKLVSDGKVYPATASKASRSMTATIDGEVYTGSLAFNQTFGIGTGFSGGRVGTVTMIGSSNQARGTLLSPTNKVLRCDVLFSGVGAQGQCQDATGKLYDFVSD